MSTGIGNYLVAVAATAVASSNITALVTGEAHFQGIQPVDLHVAPGRATEYFSETRHESPHGCLLSPGSDNEMEPCHLKQVLQKKMEIGCQCEPL